MSSVAKNFEYRMDLLRRINAVRMDGKPLSHHLIMGRYNAWHCFQSRLFHVDIADFCEGKEMSQSRAGNLKAAAASLAMRALSLLGRLSFMFRRPEVVIFSVDRANSSRSRSDARLEAVYNAVLGSRRRFTEVFYALPGKALVHNALYRKRLAVYTSGIAPHVRRRQISWEQVDLSAFSEREQLFVRSVIERYWCAILALEASARSFEQLLRRSSVRVVIAIDDTRSYYSLVLGAKLAHIPVYAVQHGRFGKYHVGWLTDRTFEGEIIRPDRLYVWSDYWRRELLQLGTYFPPQDIVVGGSKEETSAAPRRSPHEHMIVGIPYETEAVKAEVKAYIDALLQCEGMQVLFSVRSDIDRSRQLGEYGLSESYHPRLLVTDDLARVATEADLVAGTCSTFLYDMIGRERPVALLRTSIDLGEGLLRNGLADEIVLDGSLCEAVHALTSTSQEVLRERKKKLFGNQRLRMEDTIRALL